MEATGGGVGAAAELAAGVELGEDDLERGALAVLAPDGMPRPLSATSTSRRGGG